MNRIHFRASIEPRSVVYLIRKIKKPKCPKCGNKMQPYNAVQPKDHICLGCFYTTKTREPPSISHKIGDRRCPEE